jgi:hypothetical protein
MTVVANPLVVFAEPKKFPRRSDALDALPLGWTLDDRIVNPLVSGEACRLIVLNDSVAPPPGLMHGNCRKRALLPIICHASSKVNSAPDQDPQLRLLGRPVVIENFSHVPKDPIFRALEILLLDEGPASVFCLRFEGQVCRQALREAAMLCQTAVVDPAADIRAQKMALLAWRLPWITTTVTTWPSPPDWRARLKEILTEIERIEAPR